MLIPCLTGNDIIPQKPGTNVLSAVITGLICRGWGECCWGAGKPFHWASGNTMGPLEVLLGQRVKAAEISTTWAMDSGLMGKTFVPTWTFKENCIFLAQSSHTGVSQKTTCTDIKLSLTDMQSLKVKKESCNSQGFHTVIKNPRFWQKLEIAGRDYSQTKERDLYKFLKCIEPWLKKNKKYLALGNFGHRELILL